MDTNGKIKLSYLMGETYLCFLLAIFCCLACSSPSDSYLVEPIPEDASVTFSLVIPRFDLPITKTDDPSVNKDNEVDDLSILVFDANSDSTGQFLYSRTKLNVTAENKFTVDLKLSSSAIRVHVFVNAPAGSLADTYQRQIEKDVLKSIETNLDLNHSSTYTLPMHGCLELPNVVLGDINEEVQLLRSMARVDVQLDSKISQGTFKLYGVAVYFTPDKGRLVSASALIVDPNPRVTLPTLPTTAYNILDKVANVPRASVAKDGDRSIRNNLFIYENKLQSLTNKLSILTNKDYTKIGSSAKNSRIVVSGYYNGSTELSYYPVELLAILRNHQYLLSITSVLDDGYDNEEVAANSAPIDITASITWNQQTEYIIFEGKNYFHVEKRSLTLYGDAGVEDSLLVGSNIDPTAWEMSWGSDANYRKDAKLIGTLFTVEKPTKKEGGFLKFITRNAYIPDISEVLYIRVANRLELTITVTQLKGILTVDAQTGTINVNVMYYGGIYRFHVLTGDALIGWEASPDGDLSTMLNGYNPIGDDDAYLSLNIKPNLDGAPPRGVMTVSRVSGVGIDDVTLNITQEAAPYLTISPNFFNPLSAPTKLTNVPTTPYDYIVTVSDPARYTWKATTTFISSDVSLSNAVDASEEMVVGDSGDKLRLNVEGRTSEQFDELGAVTFELVRKTTNLPIEAGKQIKDLRVTAYITVSTGSKSSIYIYDRELGENVPDADTPDEYYTNKNPNRNSEFKGDLYTWSEAQTICKEKIGHGWRLPTKEEYWDIIRHPIKYLKNGAAYIEDGNLRCYFNLSGNDSGDPYYEHADYWSSTNGSLGRAWAFCLHTNVNTTVYQDNRTRRFLVRCVKDVP